MLPHGSCPNPSTEENICVRRMHPKRAGCALELPLNLQVADPFSPASSTLFHETDSFCDVGCKSLISANAAAIWHFIATADTARTNLAVRVPDVCVLCCVFLSHQLGNEREPGAYWRRAHSIVACFRSDAQCKRNVLEGNCGNSTCVVYLHNNYTREWYENL